MKNVYNEEKTQILTEYDLQKGWLREDHIINHIQEILPVAEIGHYETIRVYENGSKEVEYVIDIPAVKGAPAHDEIEEILVYVPYTELELAQKELEETIATINTRIQGLKKNLFDTDYKAIKYAEGFFTPEEYDPIRNQRQLWRNEINDLESELYRLQHGESDEDGSQDSSLDDYSVETGDDGSAEIVDK